MTSFPFYGTREDALKTAKLVGGTVDGPYFSEGSIKRALAEAGRKRANRKSKLRKGTKR